MWRWVAICLMAAPALAEDPSDIWRYGRHSYVYIVATDRDGCDAEVKIVNFDTDSEPFSSGSLWLEDMHVGIAYQLNVGFLGEERYELFPPAGYYAEPREIIVLDEDTATALICPWLAF